MLLFAEVRVFVVSGTIAQWYFQPAGANSNRVRCLERDSGFGGYMVGLGLVVVHCQGWRV